jgi:hypothetical protein
MESGLKSDVVSRKYFLQNDPTRIGKQYPCSPGYTLYVKEPYRIFQA